jgi:hypothetical protein
MRVALAASVLFGIGCSTRRIQAVDPYPCGDGAVSACVGLLDGLIGFWRLNDASGSATARDWSGWNNDGALVGIDPTTAWVADGPEGKALAPQGNGYVNVPRSSSIDSITGEVTLAAWIYIDGTLTDYATAISREIGTGDLQHYHLSINPDQKPTLFITTPATGQVFMPSPTTVPQQTWVHIAGTYDGATARLYVNAVEVTVSPVTGTFAAETNPVILSGNGNSGAVVTERIPGRLDDVMLYRRALSADEIARLKNGALSPSGESIRDAATQ